VDQIYDIHMDQSKPRPPSVLALSLGVGGGAKKRLVAPALSLTLNQRDPQDPSSDSFSAAALSTETPSLDINLDALETPCSCDTDDLPRAGKGRVVGVAWSPAEPSEGLMELDQVDSKGRRWRRFCVSGQEFHVNMSVLEPYLQVLSHGGYYGDGMNAIILFTSCYLPENTVENYDYVMENLFRYIVGTLDLMVSENYMLVYLCSLAPRNKLPAIKWLHQCYTSIDRRLKKDLKGLLVVHPAWYIKALITLVKPFISDKFSKKISFIHSLQKLSQFIPTDRLQVPSLCPQVRVKSQVKSTQVPSRVTSQHQQVSSRVTSPTINVSSHFKSFKKQCNINYTDHVCFYELYFASILAKFPFQKSKIIYL
uniref:BCL2 interacting protein like n=1 Tax=Oryzias melastigma TaxID=30732 RepID=A0A3B3CTI5_ORYME